jgi:hypothetical protein
LHQIGDGGGLVARRTVVADDAQRLARLDLVGAGGAVGDKIAEVSGSSSPRRMISSAMGRLWAFAYRSARAARISEGEMHEPHESCAGDCPEK